MLDPGEQRLFGLLSVFSGVTVEAVEEVAARAEYVDGNDVLEGLSSLVDKSLVRRVDRHEAGRRLIMLGTIREFATERLDEEPAFAGAARRAHAAYFAD